MADFVTELWTSIFTPGTTPTLLVATNATFAALQLLLLALLLATYSVHFIILSILCAGLWSSINWFVREVNQLKEEERLNTADKRTGTSGTAAATGLDIAAADGEDTETEEMSKKTDRGLRQRAAAPPVASAKAAPVTGNDESDLSASTGNLSVRSIDSRKRTSTGNVSGTDSEWDKLDSEAE